jgi:hypothetical protein
VGATRCPPLPLLPVDLNIYYVKIWEIEQEEKNKSLRYQPSALANLMSTSQSSLSLYLRGTIDYPRKRSRNQELR